MTSTTSPKPVLITGAAGFIGMHLSLALLERGIPVVGIDNVNDYYDVQLKRDRLALLSQFEGFHFFEKNLTDSDFLTACMKSWAPEVVVHLAAQAGVRYSLQNPKAYSQSNLEGTVNVLEAARANRQLKHLLMASSSSVYGMNQAQPFKETQSCEHPLSLYAATKKAGEMMAHSYAYNFGMPITNLRFFTVYGPWGRPDMGLMIFAKAICANQPIEVFNHGKMVRAFTHVKDIVSSILALMDQPPAAKPGLNAFELPNPSSSWVAPYRVLNIGGETPVGLMQYIQYIEQALGKKATIEFRPLAPGDMVSTVADCSALEKLVGFRPRTSLQEGVEESIAWYKSYYRV